MILSRRTWRWLSWALAAAVAAYMSVTAVLRPATDYDLVPYVLATLHVAGETDAATLHARTWAIVRDNVSPVAFQHLSTSDGRQPRTVYLDPEALARELPLYESKYGFVLALRALATVVDPVTAAGLLSLAGGLAVLALLVLAANRLEGAASLLWLPAVKLLNLSTITSQPMPDALCTALYAGGLAALLSARLGVAVPLFIAGAFVRPDNVILNAALAFVLGWRAPRAAIVLAAGSIAACLVCASHHVGWWGQIVYSFVGHGSVPALPFDPGLYASIVAAAAADLLHATWAYVGLGLALVVAMSSPDRMTRGLLLALVAAGALRFVAYPSLEERLYAPILFGLALLAFDAMARTRRPETSCRNRPDTSARR